MKAVQVKICGITRPEDAAFCKEQGVDAIGCVFFSKSPRFVSESQALEICSAFDGVVVGVFVNPKFGEVLSIAEKTGITVAQLHGEESEDFVVKLESEGIRVIKTLFYAREPGLASAIHYGATAFLVEQGAGGIGGTGTSWEWKEARKLKAYERPYLIAGGIKPENVSKAVEASQADGVDLSSGVERAPGIKDRGLIEILMKTVKKVDITWNIRPVFRPPKKI